MLCQGENEGHKGSFEGHKGSFEGHRRSSSVTFAFSFVPFVFTFLNFEFYEADRPSLTKFSCISSDKSFFSNPCTRLLNSSTLLE